MNITWEEREKKSCQFITVVEEQFRHAAINANLHKDKNGIGKIWERYNLSIFNDLPWKVEVITLRWVLEDPTDLWKRRGVVPGHEGRGTLGRLLELGADWTGPASHSCPVCEDPAAFAIVERDREKGEEDGERILGWWTTVPNISNNRVRICPRLHWVRDQRKTDTPTMAPCLQFWPTVL